MFKECAKYWVMECKKSPIPARLIIIFTRGISKKK